MSIVISHVHQSIPKWKFPTSGS